MLKKENINVLFVPWAKAPWLDTDFDVNKRIGRIHFRLNPNFDIESVTGLPVGHDYKSASIYADYIVPQNYVLVDFVLVWRTGYGQNDYDERVYEYSLSPEENNMLVEFFEEYVQNHLHMSCSELLKQPDDECGDEVENDESSVCGIDFSASCPWKAPGMSVDDFI